MEIRELLDRTKAVPDQAGTRPLGSEDKPWQESHVERHLSHDKPYVNVDALPGADPTDRTTRAEAVQAAIDHAVNNLIPDGLHPTVFIPNEYGPAVDGYATANVNFDDRVRMVWEGQEAPVDVLAFGAAGDGPSGTDDLSSVDEAASWADSNGYVEVWHPPATYTVSSDPTFPGKTEPVGQNATYDGSSQVIFGVAIGETPSDETGSLLLGSGFDQGAIKDTDVMVLRHRGRLMFTMNATLDANGEWDKDKQGTADYAAQIIEIGQEGINLFGVPNADPAGTRIPRYASFDPSASGPTRFEVGQPGLSYGRGMDIWVRAKDQATSSTQHRSGYMRIQAMGWDTTNTLSKDVGFQIHADAQSGDPIPYQLKFFDIEGKDGAGGFKQNLFAEWHGDPLQAIDWHFIGDIYRWRQGWNPSIAVLQNQTPGNEASLYVYPADGDGTDDVSIGVSGSGAPDQITDYSIGRLRFYGNSYDLEVIAGGTGSLYNLNLSVGGNIGLIVDTVGEVIIPSELIIGGVGISQTGPLKIVLSTEDLDFIDAGSTGATEQDWIEVTVGGNTGYLRVFANQ